MDDGIRFLILFAIFQATLIEFFQKKLFFGKPSICQNLLNIKMFLNFFWAFGFGIILSRVSFHIAGHVFRRSSWRSAKDQVN